MTGTLRSGGSSNEVKAHNLISIKRKVLVLSGKGGVGKSTVAASLADFCAADGLRTGLLDVDIHGPSVNQLFHLGSTPLPVGPDGVPGPLQAVPGLWVLSPASLTGDAEQPLIWRGPMKMKLINEFFEAIRWPALDLLLVDCPPGTGDEPLSAIQLFDRVDYALVVTTPQEMALIDVRKAVRFLRKTGVSAIGIVENMAAGRCPHCGKPVEIFPGDGAAALAARESLPLVARIEMDPALAQAGESGTRASDARLREEVRAAYTSLVSGLREKLNLPK